MSDFKLVKLDGKPFYSNTKKKHVWWISNGKLYDSEVEYLTVEQNEENNLRMNYPGWVLLDWKSTWKYNDGSPGEDRSLHRVCTAYDSPIQAIMWEITTNWIRAEGLQIRNEKLRLQINDNYQEDNNNWDIDSEHPLPTPSDYSNYLEPGEHVAWIERGGKVKQVHVKYRPMYNDIKQIESPHWEFTDHSDFAAGYDFFSDTNSIADPRYFWATKDEAIYSMLYLNNAETEKLLGRILPLQKEMFAILNSGKEKLKKKEMAGK